MGPGGWAFATTIPREDIAAAGPGHGPVLAWGAHGWRGRWLVNGSGRGLVQVTVDPAASGRCLFLPIHVRELTLSLEEPQQFIDAIGRSRAD
jgi:hypothetical protein